MKLVTELADELAAKCQTFVSEPFNTPTIVFNDVKTMQWFKYHYLDKCSVFANLNTVLVDKFVKQSLSKENNFISDSILGHKLIVFIKQNINNKELSEVKNYCSDNDEKIFDLAMQLAGLFLKYQSLEKDVFAAPSPHANWQKYLYENVCENELTVKKLYKTQSQNPNIFYFGLDKLSPLYKKILQEIIPKDNFFIINDLKPNNPQITLTAAPSKIRELENVHSKICALLNKGATLSDILVLIPKIDEYRTAIHQVFDIPKNDKNVHIPFSILEADQNISFTKDFLETFFEIARKNDFFRADFFEIVNNPVVREARGISAEEVEIFKTWIEANKIYRNAPKTAQNIQENQLLENNNQDSENKTQDFGNKPEENKHQDPNNKPEDLGRDDWHKIIDKLLLARLSSTKVDSIIPYEDLNTKSDTILWKFVSCVDDIHKWLEFSKENALKKEQVEELKDILRSWIQTKQLQTKQLQGTQLQTETSSYIGAIAAFRGLEAEFEVGAESISFGIVAKTILRGAMNSTYPSEELFTGGLSFLRFSCARVLPAKYCFLLGMDSKFMPGKDQKNTLDLSESFPELYISHSLENKQTFFTTIANTSESVYCSYVNCELAKDEAFFPSSLFASLNCKSEYLGIDENRGWNELFTSREIRNKQRNKKLFKAKENSLKSQFEIINELISTLEVPKITKIAQLKKFLEEPFSFQISRLLPREEQENAKDSLFEPTSFTALEKWSYLHEIVEENLSVEGFIEKHKDDSIIPNSVYGITAVKELVEIKDRINEKMNNDIQLKEENNKKETGSFVLDLTTNTKINWTLKGEYSWHSEDWKIFSDVTCSSPSDSKFLTMYLSSLAYWANKNQEDIGLIKLDLFDNKNLTEKSYMLKDSKEAQTLLNIIFEKAYVSRFSKVFALSLLGKVSDYQEFIKNFSSSYDTPWKYFSKKDFFDISEVCGYKEDSFEADWNKDVQELKKMIKYYE